MAIRFKFAAQKALTAIHWMVAGQPGIDLHAALKTFYFADKQHLNVFGRPIFGATYKAMRFGPVPLEIYEMMKGEAIWLAEAGVDTFPWQLNGHRLRCTDNGNVNLAELADSEAEALQAALARSLEMTFNDRTIATHGADWQQADLGYMRYEDMLEDGPHKAEIVEHLEANSRYMRL